jgi:hypothetical protein
MKSTDKFLIGLVSGIVLLVVVAFAVALLRPRPTYQPEDTPDGVVHNYLFALQEENYDRAYGYLSPTIKGYPDSTDAFIEDIHIYDFLYRSDESVTFEVESARVADDRAVVIVRETTFYGRGLFNNNEFTSSFDVILVRDAGSGAWKIISSDSYWVDCWNDEDGC